MKKVLMVVGGVIALAVVGVVGAASMQPDTTHIERTITVAATPADVFPYMNSLEKWQTWNPWAAMEAGQTITFSESREGVGAWYTWTGEETGHGKMTVRESTPTSRVAYDLEFIEPFTA